MGTTNLDLFQKYHSKGNRNAVRLNDPKLDAMIEQQATLTRDLEGRKKVLQDIQRFLIDAAANMAIQTQEAITAHWPEVKDLSYGFATGENAPYLYVWFDK